MARKTRNELIDELLELRLDCDVEGDVIDGMTVAEIKDEIQSLKLDFDIGNES